MVAIYRYQTFLAIVKKYSAKIVCDCFMGEKFRCHWPMIKRFLFKETDSALKRVAILKRISNILIKLFVFV